MANSGNRDDLPPISRRLRHGAITAASAAVLALLAAGQAQASTGCDAVTGAVFTETLVGGTLVEDGVADEADFTFEAGEKISISATLPGLSIISISFRGVTVVFDNNTNPNPRTFTGEIIAPDNGTGTIEILGANSAGGVLTINFYCASATTPDPEPGTDAGQAGSVMNSAFNGVVPGGSNGDPLADFGVPLNPFSPFGGRLSDFLCEEVLAAEAALADARANRSEKFGAMRRTAGESAKAIPLLLAARSELEAVQSQIEANYAIVGRKNRLRESLELLAQQERDRGTEGQIFGLIGEAREIRRLRNEVADEINELIEDEQNGGGIFDAALTALVELEKRKAQLEKDIEDHEATIQRARDAEQELAEADRALADAEAELERARANCGVGGPSAFLPGQAASPAAAALDALGYQTGMPVQMMATSNSFAFAYELDTARRRIERAFGAPALPGGLLGDPRFNMWINGSVTFHIDATGLAQRGTTAAVAAGASYRFLPWLNAGVAARYAHSNRFGATGNSAADAWSVAAFAQARIANQLLLETILAYSGVSANATFASGATGTALGRSWAGQAKLSRAFDVGTWTVTPALGLAIVNVQRDAFTASDGTVVAASNSTQTTLTFGPSFGPKQGFVLGDGKVTVTPNFGIGLFANLGRFDPIIGTGGAIVSSDTFGASASTGLAFAFTGGASAGVSASYSGIGGTSQSVSVSANLRVPIGGR